MAALRGREIWFYSWVSCMKEFELDTGYGLSLYENAKSCITLGSRWFFLLQQICMFVCWISLLPYCFNRPRFTLCFSLSYYVSQDGWHFRLSPRRFCCVDSSWLWVMGGNSLGNAEWRRQKSNINSFFLLPLCCGPHLWQWLSLWD